MTIPKGQESRALNNRGNQQNTHTHTYVYFDSAPLPTGHVALKVEPSDCGHMDPSIRRSLKRILRVHTSQYSFSAAAMRSEFLDQSAVFTEWTRHLKNRSPNSSTRNPHDDCLASLGVHDYPHHPLVEGLSTNM